MRTPWTSSRSANGTSGFQRSCGWLAPPQPTSSTRSVPLSPSSARRSRTRRIFAALPGTCARSSPAARTSSSNRVADGGSEVTRATLERRAAVRDTLRTVTAVLFTCAGQRVDIVSAFGRAGATTIATDLDPLAPALWHADHFELVPRVEDPAYVPALAELVEEYDVKLVVPLTDLDQLLLARSRGILEPALAARARAGGLRDDGRQVPRARSSSRAAGSRARGAGCRTTCRTTRAIRCSSRCARASARVTSTARTTVPSSTSSSATRRSPRSCRSAAAARSSPSTSSATSRAAA